MPRADGASAPSGAEAPFAAPDGETAGSPGDRKAGTRLLLRVLRHGGSGWTVTLAAASVVLAVAETLLPAVLGRALDAVLGSADATLWVAVAAALVTVLTVADVLDDLASGTSGARATAWLRRTVLRHVLALGTRGTRRFAGGDLSARVVGNAARAGGIPTVAVWTVTAIVPAIGGVIALAVIDLWLCATVLVALPLLARLARTFLRDTSELTERYLRVQASIAGRLDDAVGGARTIAAAGTAGREVRRVLAPLPELHRNGIGLWRVQTRMSVQQDVVLPLVEIAVLAVAGWLLLRGRITPGDMLAAVGYAGLAAGLGAVGGSLGGLVTSRAAATRLAEVLDVAAPPHGDRSLPACGGGRLDLRGVTVLRDGTRVLDGVDLTVPAGMSVALVGRSGSGKSLVAGLAARLLDPDDGDVALDGVSLRELTRPELRRAIGHAATGPVLIGDTVGDAIALGAPASTPDAIRRAARAARADGFLRRLPRGYRTPLSDAPMSGGEAQRVAIARAVAQGERLLVLDDVAASLDTVTEHHIGEVLSTELADRTRLVVAHRTSTAARADLVVWLDGGRVHRCGTHDRLWDDPAYRAVFAAEPASSAPGGSG